MTCDENLLEGLSRSGLSAKDGLDLCEKFQPESRQEYFLVLCPRLCKSSDSQLNTRHVCTHSSAFDCDLM